MNVRACRKHQGLVCIPLVIRLVGRVVESEELFVADGEFG